MKVPAAREFFPDRKLTTIQDNAGKAAEALNAIPFADGNLVEDIALTALTPLVVSHKLGRKPRGYIVVKSNVPPCYMTGTPNDKTITMYADNTGVFSVWFF